jgi:hypothetical protein
MYKLVENESNQHNDEVRIMEEKYQKQKSEENKTDYIKLLHKSMVYVYKLETIDIEIGSITYCYEKLTGNIFFDKSAGGRVFMESFLNLWKVNNITILFIYLLFVKYKN